MNGPTISNKYTTVEIGDEWIPIADLSTQELIGYICVSLSTPMFHSVTGERHAPIDIMSSVMRYLSTGKPTDLLRVTSSLNIRNVVEELRVRLVSIK